ncbi:AP-3 complex subunit mu-1 [Smittium mucronatum]|uniref:AP-3 complex subunit mu-1 n=1 Tax=Smittium mucronatum TaxID=133383 RepID=A0A1R0H271_9FUNG|nr:AP-3 complex subunit mu-1 [Smittium mucronatum]
MYAGSLSVQSIKDNFVIIYELLSEMIDEGHIVVTDMAELTSIVPVPNFLKSVIESVSGFEIGKSGIKNARIETENQNWRRNSRSTAPNSLKSMDAGSNPNLLPWRKNYKLDTGQYSISYLKNESFFDFEEKINTVVTSSGTLISCEIFGSIIADCRVNGMPELKISLSNSRFIDDYWFHRCVRLKVFDSSKVLSFIPPDGKFKLANYSIKQEFIDKNKILPISIESRKIDVSSTFQVPLENDTDIQQLGFHIKAIPNFNSSKNISKIKISVPLPKSAYNIDAKCSTGTYSIDSVNSVLVWLIGEVSETAKPKTQLRFKFSIKSDPSYDHAIINPISVNYSFASSISGLKIESIKAFNLEKSMYKGVKYNTSAGRCVFRSQ